MIKTTSSICLCYHNEYVPKINKDESSEAVIQKGLLMQKLDNEPIRKINDLRQLLLIDDISLSDNLRSVCYDSYDDKEIKERVAKSLCNELLKK